MINDGFVGAEDGVAYRYPRQLARVLKAQAGGGPLHVVDLGSAAGAIGSWLVGRSARFRVTGVDRDPNLVADANAIAEHGDGAIRYVEGDVSERLPFEGASIDGVVVHRLRDSIVAADRRKSLTSEIARIVRVGGYVSLLEDMRVEPGERHGAWYATRYALHRRTLELLLSEDLHGMGDYESWLADPDTALLMSLRAPDGAKLDDIAWVDAADDLAAEIGAGRVRLRGVGIHQAETRVVAEFADRGLIARSRWRVEIPEPAPRHGHAVVMKGVLFQRVDQQAS
jgi:SAM-dependent methyltransferase